MIHALSVMPCFIHQRKNSFVGIATFPLPSFQVFNANRQFLGMVKIPGQAGLRRPSGIALGVFGSVLSSQYSDYSQAFDGFALDPPRSSAGASQLLH